MKVPNVEFRDHSEGIIQKVDNKLLPVNSVLFSINMDFDAILGRAVIRKGSTQLGATVGAYADDKTCQGIYSHITSGGLKVPLVAFPVNDVSSQLYKYASGTWTGVKTFGNAYGLRFCTFLDTTMAINIGGVKLTTTDGTTWNTTGGNLDVGNCPSGGFATEFQDRIYVAGVISNPDRLYFSSLANAGTISWTVGNGYIDIEPEEGAGAITALAKAPGYLLIFKERSMKRWDGVSTYPESLINVGAPGPEAVVQARQSVFFINKSGVYETTGGYPRKISRRIQETLDMLWEGYILAVGAADADHVYFYIGTGGVKGEVHGNIVIVYNLDSQAWAIYKYPYRIKRMSRMIDAVNGEKIIAGDTEGRVWQLNTGQQDGTSDIPYEIIYQENEIGSRGRIKDISNTMVYTVNAKGCKVSCRLNHTGDFVPLGTVEKNEQKFTKDLKARYFEMCLKGTSKGVATEGSGLNTQIPTQIVGWEFIEPNVNLNYDE